jgi:hypothetical protein
MRRARVAKEDGMISRRSVLVGLGASTLAAPASAAWQCSTPNSQGIQECTAGIQIGTVHTARQLCENWCWAACIQTVFSVHGREIDQLAAVRKLFNSEDCKAANNRQIIRTINSTWIDQYGFQFQAGAEQLPEAQFGIQGVDGQKRSGDVVIDSVMRAWADGGSVRVVQELEAGNPLIIGYVGGGPVGHATVLTAANYQKYRGGVRLTKLIVRDPAPAAPNRRELTEAQAGGTMFIAKVWVR